jgi:cytochrome c2
MILSRKFLKIVTSTLAVIIAAWFIWQLQPRPIQVTAPLCSLDQEAERGRNWSITCKGCHDIDFRSPIRPSGGPNLHEVYQSLAGTTSIRFGYKYKPPIDAARNMGIVWTEDNLDQYLERPELFLRRATGKVFSSPFYMNFFIGGFDAEQRQSRRDVIAYLRSIRGRQCN